MYFHDIIVTAITDIVEKQYWDFNYHRLLHYCIQTNDNIDIEDSSNIFKAPLTREAMSTDSTDPSYAVADRCAYFVILLNFWYTEFLNRFI